MASYSYCVTKSGSAIWKVSGDNALWLISHECRIEAVQRVHSAPKSGDFWYKLMCLQSVLSLLLIRHLQYLEALMS